MACLSARTESARFRSLWLALFIAACIAGFAIPTRFWVDLPDLCLFHRVTGITCPTCGLTRSWSALLHGQFKDAIQFHPLGPATFLGLAEWTALRLRRVAPQPKIQGLLWCAAVIWIGFSVARIAGVVPGPPAP
jgi:hypothetical protein